MTPVEISAAARDLYNATGDTYFSDTQIYNWIWQACHIMAKKTFLIERMYTTTTVAGTQSYTYPSNTIGIKRITVNGKKIKRITLRDDDAITLSNATVTTQGWPIYYTDFGSSINLRPIPDAAYAMVIYSYSDSQQITATSTIELPSLFHFDLVDYVLWRMFAKDKDVTNAQLHMSVWADHVRDAMTYASKRKRTDSFATVQSEDNLPVTILGEA